MNMSKAKILPWVRVIQPLLLVGARLHGNDVSLGSLGYGDGDHGNGEGNGLGLPDPTTHRVHHGTGCGESGYASGDGDCYVY